MFGKPDPFMALGLVAFSVAAYADGSVWICKTTALAAVIVAALSLVNVVLSRTRQAPK